jgi:ribonuclease BN (tRNA processing enzyme)
VQGFPFFGPAYVRGTEIDIYCTKDAETFLAGQMAPPYFPVPMAVMEANFRFHRLPARGSIGVAGLKVSWIPLPHPQESTGFRVERDGASFVFATDTEHPGDGHNRELVEFAAGAGALVYDAQYTPDEYDAGKQGWGHSTWKEGVDVSRSARVGKLILFSHDPLHDDAACRSIESEANQALPGTWSARQGKSLTF